MDLVHCVKLVMRNFASLASSEVVAVIQRTPGLFFLLLLSTGRFSPLCYCPIILEILLFYLKRLFLIRLVVSFPPPLPYVLQKTNSEINQKDETAQIVGHECTRHDQAQDGCGRHRNDSDDDDDEHPTRKTKDRQGQAEWPEEGSAARIRANEADAGTAAMEDCQCSSREKDTKGMTATTTTERCRHCDDDLGIHAAWRSTPGARP
jgi:hypothetical protein